jgi:hypothetical protein
MSLNSFVRPDVLVSHVSDIHFFRIQLCPLNLIHFSPAWNYQLSLSTSQKAQRNSFVDPPVRAAEPAT